MTCCFCLCADENIQSGVAPTPSKHRMKRVLATDGWSQPLTGVCLFFLRPNTAKPVSTSNMVEVHMHYFISLTNENLSLYFFFFFQELCFGVLDPTANGQDMLSVVEEYLSLVMLPALTTGQKWGQLGHNQVAEFLAMLKSFTLFLASRHNLEYYDGHSYYN